MVRSAAETPSKSVLPFVSSPRLRLEAHCPDGWSKIDWSSAVIVDEGNFGLVVVPRPPAPRIGFGGKQAPELLANARMSARKVRAALADCTKLGVLEEFSEPAYEVNLRIVMQAIYHALSRAHIPGIDGNKG